MKLKEKWKSLPKWQKLLIVIRDITLYAVLLSAPLKILADLDNTILVLVCLPLASVSQAALSWRQDKKTAIFFLFGAVFVFFVYCISAVG